MAISLQGNDESTFLSDVDIGGGKIQLNADGTASLGDGDVNLDSSGRLLVGTSTARANFYNSTNSPALQVEGGDNNGSGLALIQNYNANTLGGQLILAKSNATSIGSNTLVASGDACGRVTFQGNDGAQFVEAAHIRCDIDGTPGANDMPGRLVFATTADGASSPTERMRIDKDGVIFHWNLYARTTANAANVYVGSGGDLNRSTSSGKYKTDVETLQDSYADAILGIRPVWYRSLCDTDNSDHGWWGFIAEEVAEIDPRLVHWKTVDITYDENGSVIETPCDPEPEGVAYDRFVPHLLNLIKRQKEQNASLEARLTALEGGAN